MKASNVIKIIASIMTVLLYTQGSSAQIARVDSIRQISRLLYQSVEQITIMPNGTPSSIRGTLARNTDVTDLTQAKQFLRHSKSLFRISDTYDDFTLKKVTKDDLGMTHAKLQQIYKGVPVFGSELILHSDAVNTIKAVNGRFTPDLSLDVTASISSENALNIALADLGPAEYRWQNALQEKIIKDVYQDANRTWVPKPELVIAPRKGDFKNGEYLLAWRMMIATDGAKLGNWMYFIDAKTGEIIHKFNGMPNAVGYGVSNYSDTVQINTKWTTSTYEMIDTVRLIKTYTANGRQVYPGTLITDSDNFWDQNKSAVDVHWGLTNLY